MTKVLVYNGIGAGQYGPVETKKILEKKYTVEYIQKVTSEKLKACDVFVLPGGDGGKVYLDNINGDVIRDFVKNGGKFFGTCAGAFAAANHVDGWYDGWGIAPHIMCKAPDHTGVLPVKMATGSVINLDHWNGPAMYLKGGGEILATYNDNSTGYKNYAAIVYDAYGQGKVVLSGPHPELDPQHPEIIYMIFEKLLNGGEVKMEEKSINEVITSAKKVTNFIQDNKRIPNTVAVGDLVMNSSSFLRMAVNAIVVISEGKSDNIKIVTVSDPPTPIPSLATTDQYQRGDYITGCRNLISFIDKNGRLPNYLTTTIGNLSPFNLLDMFCRALNYFASENKLPSFIYVKSVSTNTEQTGEIPAELKQYLEATANCQVNDNTIQALAKQLKTGPAIFNHVRDIMSYDYYYNTKQGAVRSLVRRIANCCDQTHLLVALCRAAGIPARYRHANCQFSDGAFGHVFAQIYVDGEWLTCDTINKRNTFGVINNWTLIELWGTYRELPF